MKRLYWVKLAVNTLGLVLLLVGLAPPAQAQDLAALSARLDRLEAQLAAPRASSATAGAAVQESMAAVMQMQLAALQYRVMAQVMESLAPAPRAASGPLGIFSSNGSTAGALVEWVILLSAFSDFGIFSGTASVGF